MYSNKFFNNLTNLNYDKCEFNQQAYESEKPMRYYINDNFCNGCSTQDSNSSNGSNGSNDYKNSQNFGYTNVGFFGGTFHGNSENKWGNVDVGTFLTLPSLTRRNELIPSYTFPVAGPYIGRADGFENKVPIDSEYMRGVDTRMGKPCDVLSEVSIDRMHYLPCNPQSSQIKAPDYVVYSGLPTRNDREKMRASCV